MTDPATIAAVMRSARLAYLVPLAVAATVPACTAGPVGKTGLAINDPAGLVDDANVIRALVFPVETEMGTTYSCDMASGAVSPGPPDDFGAEVPDAVANVELEIDAAEARAQAEVDVLPGDYVIAVQTRGDDPLSGRRDVITGTGCTSATSTEGETQRVRITVQPVLVEGECGDGVLSPDEQCDDGGTMDGDGCTADCRTEPMVISVRTGGDTSPTEEEPSVGWGPGERMAVAYKSDDGSVDIRYRLLDESGEPLDSPSALTVDREVDTIPGTQVEPAAAVGGGRAAIAFADFRSVSVDGGDILFRFFDTASGAADPSGTDASVKATAASTGAQTQPAVASRGDGTTVVVFSNEESATGLSGRLIPGGTSMPSGSDAFELGQGASAGASPALAVTDAGFVLAFASGGDVFLQRLDAMGMPVDDAAKPVVEGADAMGTQDQPAVAFVPAAGDDEAAILVAWRDDGPNGDGSGTAIRARVFSAGDAVAVGDAFVVNTTTDGDQVAPATAGGAGEIGGSTLGRLIVTWKDGGVIRARLFEPDGSPTSNREPMPTNDDFQVVGGGASAPRVAVGGPAADQAKWAVVWVADRDVHRRLFPLP